MNVRIDISGVPGSGKTTIATAIHDLLESFGFYSEVHDYGNDPKRKRTQAARMKNLSDRTKVKIVVKMPVRRKQVKSCT